MKFTKNALSVKSEDVRIISRIKGVGGGLNSSCFLNSSLLTPKIKFETGEISPTLDERIVNKVNSILSR